ncbi:Alpha/Beta hydrolase protein [Zopfochytrium polystomum]|nr:Alpha/Beta hydrolase protein [Zopfochytrium polystomum]
MPYCSVGSVSGSNEPVRIFYETHGSGPQKIIFIMGLTADHSRWDFQRNFFSQIPEYEVCVFDNRGVGFSSSPKGRYTTQMMALDTWELLQHLGWKRVHVVGLSMGGMIAQELALHVPDALLSLTLVSTTAGRTVPPFQTLWTMRHTPGTLPAEQDFKLMLRLVYPKWWLEAEAPSSTGCRTNTDYLRKWWEDRQHRIPQPTVDGLRGQRAAVYTHHVSGTRLRKLSGYGIPTLVITGDGDVVVRPSNSIYLARILRARLELFVGGGHGLAVQFPDRFNTVLLRHFRRSLEIRPMPQDDVDEREDGDRREGQPSKAPFVPVVTVDDMVPDWLRVAAIEHSEIRRVAFTSAQKGKARAIVTTTISALSQKNLSTAD